MIRMLTRIAGASAAFVLSIQAGCASQETPSGVGSAGQSASSAGSVSSTAGSSAGGALSGGAGAPGVAGASNVAGASMGGPSVGSAGNAGTSAGGSTSGGASGAGASGGSTSGGSAGMSFAGGSSSGGSPGGSSSGGGSSGGASGLGGSTNGLGTIVGSPAAAKLVDLTKNCTAANKIASDAGRFQTDSGTVVHVCTLKGGAGNPSGAAYFTADMDIDCDGLMSTHCPGMGAEKDPSYYNQTAFSGPHSTSLTSENTPYVVIPEEVKIPGLDPNGSGGNIVAIIYKGQIEFGVWGDTISYQPGDSSEPIGEASVRAAVGLGIPSSPASGGVAGGVTYIAFAGTDAQPKDMEDLAEVQALGKKLLLSLLQNNP